MKNMTIVGSALLVAACMTPAETSEVAEAGAGICDSANTASFVGRANTPALAEEARIAARARTVRVIRPGDAVTMDYRQDRLNIELDANGAVTVTRCG